MQARKFLFAAPLIAAAACLPAQAPASNQVQHVVVIYQENSSFDHYFGTYPYAANLPGEPAFKARSGTPAVDGLTPELLHHNPNSTNTANGADASNPIRLGPGQAATADQTHSYRGEQLAFNRGAMNLFPKSVGKAGPPPTDFAAGNSKALTMGYFDGNTVTALWNYAQNFALSDDSFGSTFGPSSIGAINLVSGQTNGVTTARFSVGNIVDGGAGSQTLIGDVDPTGDLCSSSTKGQVSLSGRNVGNLLTAAGATWGWFQGGFNLATVNPDGSTGCLRASYSKVWNHTKPDYVPHHEPFQYYASTANLKHLRPRTVATIGKTDAANHQYDLDDFFAAVSAGNFPAVSFLKARQFENGHPGDSDPLDEQAFLVRTLNFLQRRKEWRHTVVFIAWDDSDGWYDHKLGPTVNGSNVAADSLGGAGTCGKPAAALPGVDAANAHATGRCGYGPRLPLLAISPFARANYVDHTVTDQTSVLRFIEDTFAHGQRVGQGSFDAIAGSLDGMFDFQHPPKRKPLILDETTGEPVSK